MNISLKPDKLYLTKHIYIFLTTSVIFFIFFFLPLCLVIFIEGGPGLIMLLIITVGWCILGYIYIFFNKLWIDRLSYKIKDSNITIYKGIFTKIEQNIPNNKVTDFVLYRSLFDRYMGIGSIKVQTAGASGAIGFEGTLDGLLDYEEIHKNLRDKLISMQTATESTNNTNKTNDSVLNDILIELKKINNKLNT